MGCEFYNDAIILFLLINSTNITKFTEKKRNTDNQLSKDLMVELYLQKLACMSDTINRFINYVGRVSYFAHQKISVIFENMKNIKVFIRAKLG